MNKPVVFLLSVILISVIISGCEGDFYRSKSYLCMTDSDSISVKQLKRVLFLNSDDYLNVTNYAVTPDEQYFIINSGINGLWRAETNGDEETLLSDTLWVRNTEVSLSKDGSVIAFAARGDIYRVNVDGSDLTRLTNTPEQYEDYPGFYDDDNKLLFTSINNINELNQYHTISSMNFDGTGRENLVMENSRAESRFSYPTYLAEGEKVVYLLHGDDAGLDCLELIDGALTRFLNGDMRDNRIHVSDDGSRFAVCSLGGGKVFTSSGDIIHQDSYGYGKQNSIISPSGDKVVFTDNYDSEILNLDTEEDTRISGIQPFWVGNNLYFISNYYYD